MATQARFGFFAKARRHEEGRTLREREDLVRAWQALAPGTEAVLATVVATRGSVYRRAGARMLLTREGWAAGSVSGGCVESDLVQTAFDRTADGPVRVEYDASAPDDVLLGFGLGCNGVSEVLMERLPADGGPIAVFERVLRERRPEEVATLFQGEEVLRERVAPPPALVVFGAGHDAVPLVRLAKEVGWHVAVVDARSAFADPMRFAQADRVVVASPRDAAEKVPIEEGAAVVLMTHSYANDMGHLAWLLPSPAAYIGVLGPIHRTQRLLGELGQNGDRLFAPVGLDLGADGPDEIALAIVAEIQAVLKGRRGGHLQGRTEPMREAR